MPTIKKMLVSFILKLITDELIAPLTLFSLIAALIIGTHLKTPSQSNINSSQILGVSEKSINCTKKQCGYCTKCGNTNLNCGKLSRCIEEDNKYLCKFDINCF